MSNKLNTLLPTTVIGSHAMPSWFWTAIDEIDKGNYGETDIKETFDDAVNMAILDQERAGIDIIADGEMRRWYFVQSFYRRMTGLVEEPPLRKVGLYAYDSPPRYRTVEKLTVPNGLGIIDEFKYAKSHTSKPVKTTCPGPLTLTMHIRPKEGYKNRLDLAWEFAEVINNELKSLVEEGADYIQIDEPSFAIIPGEFKDWLELYNHAVKDVKAKLALHICFGNLSSRPRGRRTYEWMFPALLDAKAEQFVFEYSNREMSEVNLWEKFGIDRELGAGVIDVKSFHIETPKDVADRLRKLLEFTPPEKIYVNPDCGFFQLPRWITYLKLEAMVAGTNIIRNELTQ